MARRSEPKITRTTFSDAEHRRALNTRTGQSPGSSMAAPAEHGITSNPEPTRNRAFRAIGHTCDRCTGALVCERPRI